jgi:hypothetical protein
MNGYGGHPWFFSEGMASIGYTDERIYEEYDELGNFINKKEYLVKFGFIDKTGKEIIPCIYSDLECYMSPYFFSEGLACVKSYRGWGFIDKAGKEIIPFFYSWAYPFKDGLAFVSKNLHPYAEVQKFGFIDKTGKEIIPCIYDYYRRVPFANSFSEGLVAVQFNDKWGFIDKTGKEVIPFFFDWLNLFQMDYRG